MRRITIYTDGASRGNPGSAASAWLILDGTEVLESNARALGYKTNNTAEYTALISALKAVKKYGNPAEIELSVISDSQLMIRQLQKTYAVKSATIKPLFDTVETLAAEFAQITYTHVTRDNPYIGACDWLCNQTLDAQTAPAPVPQKKPTHEIICTPIGTVSSPYKTQKDAPHHRQEATESAVLHIDEKYADAIDGLNEGDWIHVLCWFHLSDRTILKVGHHGITKRPLRGVFSTRAPTRPNPISLSLVKLEKIDGTNLTVFGLEAIDGTPVLDIKAFYRDTDLP